MREEIALSSILGASVYDSSGAFAGHVREVAIFPQEDPNRISDFIVKTREGDRLLPSRQVKTVIGSSIQVNGSAHDWQPLSSSEGMLLLERDLLDQQIIDVSGRKVVRVNDVDLLREQLNGTLKLKLGRVDIGLRGAIRRLLKGLAPGRAVEALAMRMPEKSIPWEAVDLIETDPARRVRLRLAYERLSKLHPADIADILEELAPAERESVFNSLTEEVAAEALAMRMPEKSIPWEAVDLIETDPARRVRLRLAYERLAKLHPADIADILEELAPAERESVFNSLTEEVAAEALEEIDPKMQIELMRSIDSDKAADIVEEMDPDAAADLLGDLPQETSEEILEEMEPEERQEVSELLAFHENTAAGRMTTDYIALSAEHTVGDAIDRLRSFEGPVEAVSTIYLVDSQEKLVGSVPLVSLVLAPGGTRLGALTPDHVIYAEASASEKDVAEMFDKYNLLTLPVVDEEQRLTGIITADDVISLLRDRI